jgi:hypothetical protein
MKALETARRLGIEVAINLIVDPQWDERQFELVRKFALSVPEIVHLTVITPYPGTEIWHSEAQKLTTRDYRLFDSSTRCFRPKVPLKRFYEELVKTQAVMNRKHLGVAAVMKTTGIIARQLLQGQTNFVRMNWKFNSVYNPERQYGDHFREVSHQLPLPEPRTMDTREREQLYVHRRPATLGGQSAG